MLVIYLEFIGITMTPEEENKKRIFHYHIVVISNYTLQNCGKAKSLAQQQVRSRHIALPGAVSYRRWRVSQSNILLVREAACLLHSDTSAYLILAWHLGSSNPEKLIFQMRTPLDKWGDRPEVIKLISGLRAGTQAVCWNVFTFQHWL